MPEGRGINPTIIAAVCGLLGAVAGAAVTGYFNQSAQLSVERAKFQADLILQAIDTEDQATAIKTLKFFADAGLIPSYEEKIRTLAEADQGAAVPTLRATPSPYRPFSELSPTSDPARTGEAVALFMVDGRGVCTTFLTSSETIVVPAFCLLDDPDPARLSIRLGYNSAHAIHRDRPIIEIIEGDAAGIAVLRVEPDREATPMPLRLAAREPVAGEPVYMVHHPRAGPKQLSPDCQLDSERPLAPAAAVGMGGGERVMLHLSCRSEGGSAGAPVIAVSDGAVLGIHVAGRVDGFELYAVPARQILSATARLR